MDGRCIAECIFQQNWQQQHSLTHSLAHTYALANNSDLDMRVKWEYNYNENFRINFWYWSIFLYSKQSRASEMGVCVCFWYDTIFYLGIDGHNTGLINVLCRVSISSKQMFGMLLLFFLSIYCYLTHKTGNSILSIHFSLLFYVFFKCNIDSEVEFFFLSVEIEVSFILSSEALYVRFFYVETRLNFTE